MRTMDPSTIEPPVATQASRVEGRWPLWFGIVGSVLFTGTFLVEGSTRPGYDPFRQPISALSLGERGWVQAVSFVVFGLLLAGFARGLALALAPGTGSKWAPRLQVIAAVGLIIDGLFAQDPDLGYPPGVAAPAVASGHALLHLLGAIMVFTALPLRCFVLARRFATESQVDRRWRGWAAWSVTTGVVFWALLAAFVVASGTQAGPAGLFEKLASIVMSVYGVSLASKLLAGVGHLSVAPRLPEERSQ